MSSFGTSDHPEPTRAAAIKPPAYVPYAPGRLLDGLPETLLLLVLRRLAPHFRVIAALFDANKYYRRAITDEYENMLVDTGVLGLDASNVWRSTAGMRYTTSRFNGRGSVGDWRGGGVRYGQHGDQIGYTHAVLLLDRELIPANVRILAMSVSLRYWRHYSVLMDDAPPFPDQPTFEWVTRCIVVAKRFMAIFSWRTAWALGQIWRAVERQSGAIDAEISQLRVEFPQFFGNLTIDMFRNATVRRAWLAAGADMYRTSALQPAVDAAVAEALEDLRAGAALYRAQLAERPLETNRAAPMARLIPSFIDHVVEEPRRVLRAIQDSLGL